MSKSIYFFQIERIGLELIKYKKMLNHNESTYEYINTKNQIKDSLGKFKLFRSDLNSLL